MGLKFHIVCKGEGTDGGKVVGFVVVLECNSNSLEVYISNFKGPTNFWFLLIK